MPIACAASAIALAMVGVRGSVVSPIPSGMMFASGFFSVCSRRRFAICVSTPVVTLSCHYLVKASEFDQKCSCMRLRRFCGPAVSFGKGLQALRMADIDAGSGSRVYAALRIASCVKLH